MKAVVRLFVILLCAVHLSAQAALPTDFASGLEIDSSGRQPLVQVTLPEAVYTKVMFPAARDLMVFNHDGATLPYTLHAADAFLETERREHGLAFYPVWEDDRDEQFKSFRVIRDESGAVANIIPNQETDTASRKLRAFLVVLPEPEKGKPVLGNLVRLRIDWQAIDRDFTALASVEQSDDLVHWRRLVDSAALTHVTNNGNIFEQRDIKLLAGHGKYLRIGWPAELARVVPAEISGEFELPPQTAPEQSHVVVAQPVQEKQGMVYEFDSAGRRPVSSVQLAFAGQNVVLKGALKSRDSLDAEWTTRYRGSFYQKTTHDEQGNELIDTRRLSLEHVSDRFWRFEPEAGQVTGADIAPQLVIGWRPDMLVFLQRGPAPYTIAYGRYAVEESNGRSNNLYADLGVSRQGKAIAQASEFKQVVLGGDAMLVAPPPPLPWKRWALWAALGLGMLLLLYMVRQLLRQMSSQG